MWNNLFSLPSGLLLYFCLEWYLHATAAHGIGIIEKGRFPLSGKMFLFTLLSIGYAFAYCYKNESTGEQRKQYIKKCNRWNWVISLILMICSFSVVSTQSLLLIPFFQGISGYRFISRSLEIIWAFGFDVVHKPPYRSNLDKFQRLQLALMSYSEIYLYSASFYVTIINNSNDNLILLHSLLMSLSVGSLTNVAYSQNNALLSDWLQLFPFIQVIASASLVVLGLAIYLSRGMSIVSK